MISKERLNAFIEPYYIDKDIMHNMWHIELVRRQMKKIVNLGKYKIDEEILDLALAFHGFIYKDEEKIRSFLLENVSAGWN